MISASHISLDLGGRTLLNDISFTAEPGHVTGLIGPNGAGKSTLLAVLCGDLERRTGTVDIAGVDPASASSKELAQRRAVMLQDVSVSFEFLVRDVVAMGRRPWEGSEYEARDQAIIDAALSATDTSHLAGRDIATLSGGERARVALARVLAQQTPVIMLDEPTAALDIKHQEQVLGLVQAIARAAGVAVVVVLHDLNAAASYCDKIICLANGTIAAMGSVDDVYTAETLSTIYGWPIEVTHNNGVISVHPKRRCHTPSATEFISLLQ
ncbi:heme ABC transporter ATP-binding protein [Corynebacterium sp. ES2794-CONJ1]|uniref:heme ABC transporter ATP-binding protein n=1 Tax=unclassified Corynebacterium TaxID=2624378 RepID=UPI0021674FF6|nr:MULTISPECIES: heme ABC transporter ATP-binding protein [unclassified Corynebacterium]MCS4489534.1 heme ABC transporter ATP-binding protein [Corynebacterium sp. ES2775-CONJ]MCS4491455.1 heme ABC transporter ATP-binding protein [Corynebacterium sp. ES2715-CONJ3]MCS4531444.1 heme ABC transporter ATP-binding protein [Corynebacterium sp. ES2730-CONJ]MCU9518832.1 heme ABC transporter ATP-binding protein [Corynebacterium sp. ES2794-CONJ1]